MKLQAFTAKCLMACWSSGVTCEVFGVSPLETFHIITTALKLLGCVTVYVLTSCVLDVNQLSE